MKKLAFIILLAGFLCGSCQPQHVESVVAKNTNSVSLPQNEANPVSVEKEFIQMRDYFTEDESLNYKEFTVKKVFHEKKPDDLPAADISDAVIQKNGKTLIILEGVYYPLGNGTDFGLFSFFSDNEKQLVVSHTIPRGGMHYVVNLSTKPKIIFDSAKYNVGREDFGMIDIDGDGIYEISLESTAFYGLEIVPSLANMSVPLTSIYFKYDKKIEQFVPSNHKLQDFILRDIDNEISRINRQDKETQFADVLAVTLKYVYAGKEKEAWEFFDREYTFDDKNQRKTAIRKVLMSEPTYKFIRRDLRKRM